MQYAVAALLWDGLVSCVPLGQVELIFNMWDCAASLSAPTGAVRVLPSAMTLERLQAAYNPEGRGIFKDIGVALDNEAKTNPEPVAIVAEFRALPEHHVLRRHGYQKYAGTATASDGMGRPMSPVVLQLWDGGCSPQDSAYVADVECVLLWRQTQRPRRSLGRGHTGAGVPTASSGALKLQTQYRVPGADQGRRGQVAATIARSVAPSRISAAVICPYMLQVVQPKRKCGWASVCIVPGGSVTLSAHRDKQTYVVTNLNLPRQRTCGGGLALPLGTRLAMSTCESSVALSAGSHRAVLNNQMTGCLRKLALGRRKMTTPSCKSS